MPGVIVVGLQWGDEGKGKIVDFLASKSDMVVRFNGGSNAGHSVVVEGVKYKFHIMPSGVLSGKQVALAGGAPMNSSGTLGINITSTNQIAVYTSSAKNNSAFSFIPVTPPAAGSITLMSNESSNVTSGDTSFLVENQGNVNVSITVASDKNASLFIGGSTPLFRMFGAQNKTGSCPGINATMQDLGNTPITICPSLAFADTQDTIWAYVLVRINSDSPPQTNTATLTFTSTQV